MLVSYTLKSERDFKNQMFYSFYTVGFPAGCGGGFQTLCDPTHSSPPGSYVHGILQARVLEWVAISSSGRSSQPRDQIHISYVSCIGKRILSHQHHVGVVPATEKRKGTASDVHKFRPKVRENTTPCDLFFVLNYLISKLCK